jgi:hypothetical protein
MSEETINIYNYDTVTRAFTGLVRTISIYEGAPRSWTFQAPPEVPEGHSAHYVGSDWVISSGQKEMEKPTLPPQSEPEVI